ncbi:unnamed protein product [Pipistrellus nathusii]|uniref:Peptidase A1 domain-containing protein n=1 Tax=Pipistrellus nathusii TaxID=59473 RepID=A0ABP0AGD0_PIPNA
MIWSVSVTALGILPFDGILGLAYPSLAIRGTTPVFDGMWNNRLVSQNQFAFYLSSKKENGSVVMFGGVDPTYYQGRLQWVPVSTQGHWNINMNSITINRKVVACPSGCQAIMDTGTSMLVGPTNDFVSIMKSINAQKKRSSWYVNCAAIPSLPDIIFTINGLRYSVPPSAYIRRERRGVCYPNFLGSVRNNYWTLGDVFMRLYVTVFDRANNRIGLAPARA